MANPVANAGAVLPDNAAKDKSGTVHAEGACVVGDDCYNRGCCKQYAFGIGKCG
ncbi:hypothetical protein E4U21_001351 [Claviceps maximensis]|nr:hypothetical protein E4U21_001351 [Claviceps maximensis]